VSAISPKSSAGSFNLSVPEAPDQASGEGQGATPAGGWQQAAGIFSAIANMLSSDLTTQETDRQKRADLIQKLGMAAQMTMIRLRPNWLGWKPS